MPDVRPFDGGVGFASRPCRRVQADQRATGDTFLAGDLLAIFGRAIEPRDDLVLSGSLELMAEYAGLARRLASWSRRHGLAEVAADLEERASHAEQQAGRVRERLIHRTV